MTFCFAFEARGMDEDDTSTPKYSITMLFDKATDLTSLRRAVKAAVAKKWGDKPPKGLKTPFRDAGEKSDDWQGFQDGMTFVRASSKYQPGVVDASLNPITDRKELYSGCYARASVVAFAYDNRGNKGVSFALNNIQKLRDGEPLGGMRRAEDDFEAVKVAANGDDDDYDDLDE